ncbi:MAG: hypothetical protein GY915_06615 [bacterium]|nr:hypothetical protein [bacterium]
MSFFTNLRQKDFMRWIPWFFGCCVLWGVSLTLDPASFLIFNTGLDYSFWNGPVVTSITLVGVGFLYWGAISKFSYQNVVFFFSILYGLLCLNLLLYDLFPIKPEPAVVALVHIFSIAWRGIIPILIFTGANRFLDVKMGMRIYPILIILMNVGVALGTSWVVILRMYSESHPAEFKWPGIIAIFAMAFLLRKFSGLPAIQKRGMTTPYLVFPRFVFGIFVFVLGFIHILPRVWHWCVKWVVQESFPFETRTAEGWRQMTDLFAYGGWVQLAAFPLLLGLTLWIAYRKGWQTLLWTWAGMLGAVSLILMVFPYVPPEVVGKPTLIGMNFLGFFPASLLFIALKEPIYLAFSVEMRTKFKPVYDSAALGLAALWAPIWNTWVVFLDANPVMMAAALTLCVALFSFLGLSTIGKHLKLEKYT